MRFFESLVCLRTLLLLLSSSLSTSADAKNATTTTTARKRRRILLNNRRQRRLQQNETTNPCTIPFEEASLTNFRGNVYLLPSFFEDCVSNLQVDKDHMLHFLTNTQETFRQYYSFYNIVNDPSASDPKSHQPELGYSIFGVGQGQVQLDARLTELQEQVETAGAASGKTFWDYRAIINQLRDAHVALPTYNINSVANEYIVRVYARRSLAGGGSSGEMGSASFDYDENGEMTLKIEWRSSILQRDPTSVDTVVALNELSVFDFVANLTNLTAVSGLVYQSHGARVNQFINDQSLAWPGLLVMTSASTPSLILPDSFEVLYESGEVEDYYTLIQGISLGPRVLYDSLVTKSAEAALNAPGQVYLSFREAIQGLSSSNTTRRRRTARAKRWRRRDTRRAKDTTTPHPAPPRNPLEAHHQILQAAYQAEMDKEHRKLQVPPATDEEEPIFGVAFEWDELYTNFFSPAPYAALKLYEDYAVLKIESFVLMPIHAMELWTNVTRAARSAGIKKLLIDISNNGGGIVQGGDALSVSIFPSMKHENWFVNAWDVKVNEPMLVYNESVQPIVDSFLRAQDVLTVPQLQQVAASYTSEQLNRLQELTTAMIDFCLDACELGLATECDPTRCSFLQEQLSDAVDKFTQSPTALPLLHLIETVAAAMDGFNPWTVIVPGLILPNATTRTVNRGGVASELSNPFTFFSSLSYAWAALNALEAQWSFDEYVIVSNGAAGSTTSIFASTLEQYYNNAGTASPVTTVSYGGIPGDTTMAGFAASVQDTRIEYPLITDGLLLMLETLVPPCPATNGSNCQSLQQSVTDARTKYESVLPVPGYFGETLTYLPVVNYYSLPMNPGALPLQYVNMPSDQHISRIYTQTRIGSPTDLPELYSQAATYFTNDTTETIPGCAQETERCASSSDCCDYPESAKCGLISKRCVSCLAPGSDCLLFMSCCTNHCQNGICQAE